MYRHRKKRLWKAVLGIFIICFLILGMDVPVAGAAGAETVKITILQTGDLHGMIYPYDYALDAEVDYGLTKAAAVVKNERARDPDLVLVDTGDFIQGNFLSELGSDGGGPMVQAMNYLGYDAVLLGEQEIGIEAGALKTVMETSKAAVLCGNLYQKDGTRLADAYIVKEVKGVKVGLFGLNLACPVSDEGFESILNELEGKADVIVGVIHAGGSGQEAREMAETALKYADKIDALLIGHVPEGFAVPENFTIPFITAGKNGSAVGKCVLTLEHRSGKWEVKDAAAGRLETAEAVPEKGMTALMEPVHKLCLQKSDQIIGRTRDQTGAGDTETGTLTETKTETDTDTETETVYEVRKGDALWTIASKYGVTVDRIAEVNQIQDVNKLAVGQKLKIPAVEMMEAEITDGTASDETAYYVVAKGDTLSGIGQRYGIRVADLVKLNGIENENMILVGSRLKLPAA